MTFRSIAVAAALLSLAPLGYLSAQQAASPTGTATTVDVAAPAAVTPGPAVPPVQYSPLLQKSDSAPVFASADKSAMAAAAGSNHTIVISTLVLVLAIVILVLLIA